MSRRRIARQHAERTRWMLIGHVNSLSSWTSGGWMSGCLQQEGGACEKSDADRVQATGSEERRVGKECRSRWSPYHYKKNDRKKYSAASIDSADTVFCLVSSLMLEF